MTRIFSATKGRKIVDDRIAKADVTEIDLLSLFELVVEILGKRRTALDDEAFLEDVDVSLNGLAVQSSFPTETFVGDFLSDSVGKQLHKMLETGGTSHILQGIHVSEQQISA